MSSWEPPGCPSLSFSALPPSARPCQVLLLLPEEDECSWAGLGCASSSLALLGAPRKEVYFMAIIDILTPYDAKKKAAHAAKTVKHGVRSLPPPGPGGLGGSGAVARPAGV